MCGSFHLSASSFFHDIRFESIELRNNRLDRLIDTAEFLIEALFDTVKLLNEPAELILEVFLVLLNFIVDPFLVVVAALLRMELYMRGGRFP